MTLTATVTSGATGNVIFYDGLTYLGSAALSGGHAALTTNLLASGVRSLRAAYTGDTACGPGYSANSTVTVQAAAASGIPALDQL